MIDTPESIRGRSRNTERTPLLSASVGIRAASRSSFPRPSEDSTARSLPHQGALFPQPRRPSSEPGTTDLDVDQLWRDVVRSASLVSTQGDYGNTYATSDRVSDWARKVSQVNVSEHEVSTTETTALLGQAVGQPPDPVEHPKFIGLTPTRFWLVFSVILICYFLACLEMTLMASAHPVITSYFGASKAASWLSTSFLITSTAFQPLFARFSDTFGRRYVYTIALLLFAATTTWCALAQSIGSLIAARAACGIGAGGVMAMSLIILSDTIPIENRAVFQSHINIAYGLGASSGAAFGGYLCDTLGWRWAFGMQVPLMVLGAVLAFLATPSALGPMLITQSSSGSAFQALRQFDWPGSALLILCVTSLVVALTLGGNIYPWLSSPVLSGLGLFLVLAPIFVYFENQAMQPLMPMRLLTTFPIANVIFSNTLAMIASNTLYFNVPIFFQAVMLTSASDSGLRLVAPSLVASFAGISSGYIINYTGRLKSILTFGAVTYLIGSIAVCFLRRGVNDILSLVLISGVSLGQGFIFPPSIMTSLAVSDRADHAIVNTTLSLWKNIGIVLGIALSSLVFQNMLGAQLEEKVTGEGKREVIEAVRSSVKAITMLTGETQREVVDAYAASLRIAFTVAVAASVGICCLLLPVRLPRLTARKVVNDVAE